MASQQSCLTQFDLMMNLASKKDSAAKIFDNAAKHMPKHPTNNIIFENITVGLEENKDSAAHSELHTPLRASRQNTNHYGDLGVTDNKEKPISFVKDRLRQMQRVWSAMSKFIASQTANGRTVDLPLAGKFKKQRKEDPQNGVDSGNSCKYVFMPHLDFIGSGHFKYPENDSNVSPFSKTSACFAVSLCTVSLTSVGAVCSLDRESVATALKSILIEFIKQGRSGRYCKLDMRIGYLVAYPNGTLQFENYPDNGNLADQEDQVNLAESSMEQRFTRRNGVKRDNLMGDRSMENNSMSMTRSRQSALNKVSVDKRSQSLYSSVRVSKNGFSRLSNNTSIMTPYTNIGGEVSRYGGKNRTLKQWYEGKCFQPGSRTLGQALNKREFGANTQDIYSQFSSANPEDYMAQTKDFRSSMNSQAEAQVMESLKNNEFLPQVTFENFLAKKVNKGKRTLFLNNGANEQAKSYMKEYQQQSKARSLQKAEDRVNKLDEERHENALATEQFEELQEIANDKKMNMQFEHRENVKQGVAENNMKREIQRSFDKAYGFNAFPYTHGDDVEKAQQSATKKWREELTQELEQKGSIKLSSGKDSQANSAAQQELQEKASSLTEAKKNEHMLNLQTGSVIIRNQVRKDDIDFKNSKQEELFNKFIQETPFYARQHKAQFARPAPYDAKNTDSVARDARKRFEMDLMRSKQKEVEDEKELKALEEENERFEMACDVRRKQEKQAIREILSEQMQMDKMRKKYDQHEVKDKTETHFGPQEDNQVTQSMVNRRREIQNMLNSQLNQQIEENAQTHKKKLFKEKLTDSVNMGAVNQKLRAERQDQSDKRRQQIHDYREAWSSQIEQKQNKDQVESILQGTVV